MEESEDAVWRMEQTKVRLWDHDRMGDGSTLVVSADGCLASPRIGPTWCRSADKRREAAVTGEIGEEEAERANVSTT